jgi:hypothetical protein
MTDTIQFHPAANIFPMDDENLDSLAEDIKASGLLVPIELLDGKIVDGRRRWMACRMAGVKPAITDVYDIDDPVAYVLSLNLHRRHLDTSQLAMVGAKARELHDKAAKERQREHGGTAPGKKKDTCGPGSTSVRARDAAGKAVGVSGISVDRATRVLNHAEPEVIKAVEDGRLAVKTAARLSTEPPEVQREVAANPKGERPKRTRPKKPPAKRDVVTDERVGPNGMTSVVFRAVVAITNELKVLSKEEQGACLREVLVTFPLPK